MSKRIIVPAYDPYPGPVWDEIFPHAADVAFVILNCNSGVGSAIDPVYVAMRKRLKDAGISCLGYVSTRYGSRPIGEVQAEIGLWYSWYKVDGIFADEQASEAALLPYYRRVKSSTGSAVLVTNPGTVPDAAYADLDAIICVAETNQQTYLSKTFPDWVKNAPRSRFYHICFGVRDQAQVQAKIDASNAEFFYMTSVGGTDPQFTISATLWPAHTPAPVPEPATSRLLSTCTNEQLLAEVKRRLDS